MATTAKFSRLHFKAIKAGFMDLAYSSDGARLAALSRNWGIIKIYIPDADEAVLTGNWSHAIDVRDPPHFFYQSKSSALSMTDHDQAFCAFIDDKGLWFWDGMTPNWQPETDLLGPLTMSRNGKFVAYVKSDKLVRIRPGRESPANKDFYDVEVTQPVSSFAFSLRGDLLAIATADGDDLGLGENLGHAEEIHRPND